MKKIQAWHGTTSEFSAFDTRHLGHAVRNPTTEFGFWFSDDPEDAASWAFRARHYGTARGPTRLLKVALNLTHLRDVSAKKFNFYLQVARTSTIQRDLKNWRKAGYDGMTVNRGETRWFCAFDPADIHILETFPLSIPQDADLSP